MKKAILSISIIAACAGGYYFSSNNETNNFAPVSLSKDNVYKIDSFQDSNKEAFIEEARDEDRVKFLLSKRGSTPEVKKFKTKKFEKTKLSPEEVESEINVDMYLIDGELSVRENSEINYEDSSFKDFIEDSNIKIFKVFKIASKNLLKEYFDNDVRDLNTYKFKSFTVPYLDHDNKLIFKKLDCEIQKADEYFICANISISGMYHSLPKKQFEGFISGHSEDYEYFENRYEINEFGEFLIYKR